jgi:hypothetical protein
VCHSSQSYHRSHDLPSFSSGGTRHEDACIEGGAVSAMVEVRLAETASHNRTHST